jgi:hypothetical protein
VSKKMLVHALNVFSWDTCKLESSVVTEYSGPVMQMAAPADYLDVDDLKDVAAGGIVREDVLDEIFDISDIPTPFLDMIASDGFTNTYSEWDEDKLADPDTTNARVSGSDSSSANNKATVANVIRVGNHAQISTKDIQITERSAEVNSIGMAGAMGYQTARRLQELRRDVEAICLSNQASVQDDGDAVAGQSAGAGAWIKTNDYFGGGGASGGFNTGTKLVAAPTVGNARSLTWEMIATGIEAVYLLGGNTTVLMSVPQMTKRLARYLFSTPYAATPTANVNGTGGGVSQTSQGYIDVFRTDFGTTMEIVPNRLQQLYLDSAADPDVSVCNVYGLDPRFWKLSTLYGWKLDALGKTGLSHKKLAHVDWMLKCLLERANFCIRDIDPTVAVTENTSTINV